MKEDRKTHLKEVIQVFNDLKVENEISDYAIGGGMATIFYVEPFETSDIDIFVLIKQSSFLISLDGIYSSLNAKGYNPKNEYVEIGDFQVQILVAPSALEEEAVREAKEITFEGLPCKILRAEHLLAICLKVGRARDYYKATILLEQASASIDMNVVNSLISKYNLQEQWNKLNRY